MGRFALLIPFLLLMVASVPWMSAAPGLASPLERAGLAYNFGRMVLEVRPPVPVDKGAAVVRLRGRKRIDNLLFVGDDRSDLDAFREATIRIAVNSAEVPKQLIQAADAVVDGPPAVVALLDHLADMG